jgi:hypothetical protein
MLKSLKGVRGFGSLPTSFLGFHDEDIPLEA